MRALEMPTRAMPVRSLPSRNLAQSQPLFSCPTRILRRHFHVVEEDLVDLVAAVDGLDRAHGDARRLHVDEQEGNALLFLRRRIGAHQAEDPVGILRQRGPGLLAVDHVVAVGALRRSLQRREIGAGAGLGEALAPPIVEIGDARQIFLLLRFIAEGDDDRAHHAHPERQWLGRRRLLHLVAEQIGLHRSPSGAAPLLRPVRHRPALGIEDALPGDHVLLSQAAPGDHLGADRRRQLLLHERAHLVAKRDLFRREAKVHGVSPGAACR